MEEHRPRRVRYRTRRDALFVISARVSEEDVNQPDQRAKDRRVQKTQNLLREALASLILEKDYDSILVQEILDRANVGRSTFYMHFRDKDDLLVSGIKDMVRRDPSSKLASSAKTYEKLIQFSLPIFEYHDRHRRKGVARMGARGRAILHEHLRRTICELITDDVRKALQGRRKAPGPIPATLVTEYVASTFHLVLNWWVESRSSLRAKEINDLFRALVLPTLAASA